MWLDDLEAAGEGVDVLVAESALTRPQVDAVLRYRAAYPAEVVARIELHRHETAAAALS